MRDDGLPVSETRARDFLYLLDRLEEALTAGSRVPLTARTLVDEGECLDVIDQLRVALPGELKEARRIVAERDHVLTQAREEAERLVRAAELRASRLVEEHAIVREARARALQIEDGAERAADQIRTEAEQYAGQVLGRVGDRLEQALGTVRASLRDLEAGDASIR